MIRSALLAASAALAVFAACTGGSEPPASSSDAGSDAGGPRTTTPIDAGGSSSGSSGGEGNPCVTAKVADPNASTSGGPGGCTQPSDCTVRYTGSYCCPIEPQAMTNGVAAIFDEGHNGAPQMCRDACQTVRCAPPPRASATCTGSSCALAPDGG